MKRSKFLPGSIVAGLLLLVLCGCKQENAQKLSAAAPPQVFVAPVEQRDVPIVREWIGQLDGSQNVDVRARVHGYIQEIAFKEGTVVKPGDLLLRIDPRPFEAAVAQEEADLAQAIAAQEKTQLDENRQKQLWDRKITSQQDYDNAVKANLGAKAAVEAARAALDQAKLNLAFATIDSPIAGIVGRTDFSVGNFLAAGSAGTAVTTVSTVDPIKIVFAVSEKEYLGAAERLAAMLAQPLDQREAVGELIRADGKVHPYKGRFLAADRRVLRKPARFGSARFSQTPATYSGRASTRGCGSKFKIVPARSLFLSGRFRNCRAKILSGWWMTQTRFPNVASR